MKVQKCHHPRPKGKKLAQRLPNILAQLYQGACLDKHLLATQFGVDVRTIERDLGERLRGIVERGPQGGWQLASALYSTIPVRHLEDHVASETTEVLLRVAPEVAHSFALLHPPLSQQKQCTDADGSLLITIRTTQPVQLFPVALYWLPNVQILQPLELRQAMLEHLRQIIEALG